MLPGIGTKKSGGDREDRWEVETGEDQASQDNIGTLIAQCKLQGDGGLVEWSSRNIDTDIWDEDKRERKRGKDLSQERGENNERHNHQGVQEFMYGQDL